MQGTMMDFPLTLPPILERANKIYPHVEIVSRMADKSLHRYTYADFYKRARALAEALQKIGLKKGERVGTLMWNHYAHLEAYFGVPCAGGIVHMINLRLSPTDIAYIIGHAKDRFLIIDDVLLPLVSKLREHINVERIFVVPIKGDPLPEGYESYEDLLKLATGDFTYPDIDENDGLGMCYTSGTTGKPKGVIYSHRAIVLHSLVSTSACMLGYTQFDTLCPVVPMFHVNAWGLPYTATLAGAKQVYPGPYLDPVSLLDLFEAEQVTHTAGVPTIWFGILQAIEANPDKWKLVPGMQMLVGGAAAPESMLRAFDRHNLFVVHAWGMTEMTPLGTVSALKKDLLTASPDVQYAYRAKQGVPAPFVEIRGMNEAGEVPWDGATMGELQVRGPWIASSYYDQPDAQDRWTDDGWFRTGDVVTIDADGYVKITDRTKDLIKSGGEWISSVDLENALMGHPAVAEAAVIARPDPKWQERPMAIVVLKRNATATPEELRAYLAQMFADWWLPDDYLFQEELPHTATGKFLKTKLREQFVRHPAAKDEA